MLSARLALPLLVLGAVAIGFSPIFVRLSEVGPVATAFHRVLLALPVLWLWMRVPPATSQSRLTRADYVAMLAAGIFFACDLAVWHWSIVLTSVANATLLANFAPVFVTVGAWTFLRERITLGFLVGLGLAIGGVLLLMAGNAGEGTRPLVGDALGLLTGVFYAGYLLSVKHLRATVRSATILFTSGIVTAAALLPIAALSEDQLIPATVAGWAAVLALAVLVHAGGQGLITGALKHLPASFSSVTLLLQPLVAALLAWVWLDEALGLGQAVGGALVLAGIVQARRASEPHPSTRASFDRLRMRQASWEHFPHDADVGIRGRGPTLAAAFEQAGLALTAVVTAPPGVAQHTSVAINCAAVDPELLLLDWLNAIIYEMATRSLVFGRYAVQISGTKLTATAWGERVDVARHAPAAEPKAATFLGLAVRQTPDGAWSAECVVDV